MNYIDKLAAAQKWIEDSGLPERDILSVVINNTLDLPPRIQIDSIAFLTMFRGRKVKRNIRGNNTHYEFTDGTIEVTSCKRENEPSEIVTI